MPQIGSGPFSSPQVESDVNRNLANNQKRLQVNHPNRIQADQQQAQNAQNNSWMRTPGSPMQMQGGHVIGMHDAYNRNTIDPQFNPSGMDIRPPAINQFSHESFAHRQAIENNPAAAGRRDLTPEEKAYFGGPLDGTHAAQNAPTHNVMPRQATGVAATGNAPKLAAPSQIAPIPGKQPFSERQQQFDNKFLDMFKTPAVGGGGGLPAPPMPGNVPDPMHQALAGGGGLVGHHAPQQGPQIPPQIAKFRQENQQNIDEVPQMFSQLGLHSFTNLIPGMQDELRRMGPERETGIMKNLSDIQLANAQAAKIGRPDMQEQIQMADQKIRMAELELAQKKAAQFGQVTPETQSQIDLNKAQAQHLGQESPEDQVKTKQLKMLDEYGPEAMGLVQSNPSDPNIPRLRAIHQASKLIPHIQSHIMGDAATTEKSILGHHPDINHDIMADLMRTHFPDQFNSLIHGQERGMFSSAVPPQPWARHLDPTAVGSPQYQAEDPVEQFKKKIRLEQQRPISWRRFVPFMGD